MSTRRIARLLVMLAAGLVRADGGIEGDWNGVLHAGPIQLRVALHLARESGGGLKGTLDSIDQSAEGIPLSKVTESGPALEFEIEKLGVLYKGQESADGSEIAGTFRQRGTDLPLTLRRGVAPELVRPQNPKPPYPYDEEEVSYENAKAGIRLAATLTLPRSAGPHPCVLLITGSGPQDRDEAIMGHQPFLVIADYLTRQGVAVLRADDRGVGKSTGKFQDATTTDFADDARAGVNFLKARKDIDPRRIGLIGHSEGGVIAPMLASESTDIAFIVMLAGSGVRGDELLLEQQYLIGRAMGVPEDIAEKNRGVEREILRIVKEEPDRAAAEPKIRAAIEKLVAGLPEDQRKAESRITANVEAQIRGLSWPWFRAFLLYDPRPALEKVKAPVLAMAGELDLQVPPKQNLPAIAAALEAGGNPDYQIVKLPKLNHLFQTARTGSPMEYAQIEETFSPAALEVMGAWISRHVK